MSFTLDGEAIEARRGEPVAIALLAAGVDVFARSVKYHRPRGPFCLDGRCEGCHVREDGLPNVPACRTAVRDGLAVERQNAFPSAQVDFLEAIDWFFPSGMDHHEMFSWLPGPFHRAMQRVARRVGGLGRLPADAPAAIPEVRRVAVDVLVVGGGPAGLCAAAAAAEAGRSVVVVDEEDAPGGLARLLPGEEERAAALTRAARQAGVTIRSATSVVAVYDLAQVAIVSSEGLEVASVTDLLLCNGTHAQPPVHENNDLPGHLSATAVLRAMVLHDLVPARRAVVTGPDALGDVAAAALAAAGVHVTRLGPERVPVRARGDTCVGSLEVREPDGKVRRVPCDLVVVAQPPAPAFELARQAGCAVDLRLDRGGFVPRADSDGRTRAAHVRVAGRLAGAASIDEACEQGRRAGALA